jgi:hypothetical protein
MFTVSMKITASESKCLGLLLLVQLVMTVIIQPSGNFPLNDDWAYSHSVEWLLSEGRIRLSDWIAPNLLPQTLLGASVSTFAGFSFENLKHLTQLIAILTSLAVFYWFRTGKLSPVESLFASLVVISMPSWAVLANSYMSDFYGMLFAVVGATMLLRSLKKPSTGLIISATAVVCVGMLQRQVLLVIPFAFMLAWFWEHRRWTPRIVFFGLLPLFATIVTELLYFEYLSSGPGVPEAQIISNDRLLPFLFQALLGEGDRRQAMLFNLAAMIAYLGLFFVAWAAWWGAQASNRKEWFYWTALTLSVAAVTLFTSWLPPYLENNTIDAAGIGPFTVYDGLPRELVVQQRQAGFIWPLAGLVAAFGISAVLVLAYKSIKQLIRGRNHADAQMVFTMAVIAAYAVPFLITAFFDRYLLFILPFVLLLWSQVWPRAENQKTFKLQKPLALTWVAFVLILSSIATHDYFAWNRARWDAISYAESIGASPETLDGGFEYNGYYRFEQQPRIRVRGKSFWWVKDDEYAVTFSEVAGYELLRSFPVNRYSNRTQPEILLLHRKNPDR